MRITKLIIEEFMSYKYAELDLSNRGLLLISGENGSGKSSINEALCWSLFGCTHRGIKTDQVVRRNSSNTRVTTEIEVNNQNVKIVRHRQHSEYNNKVLLYINNQDCTLSSDKETNLSIEQTLGLNYEFFSSVVMFGQGATGFASYTDSNQKFILEKILNLERFNKAHAKAKSLLNTIQSRLQVCKNNLLSREEQYNSSVYKLQRLKDLEKDFDIKKQLEINELEEQLAHLKYTPPKIIDYKQKINTLSEQLRESQYETLKGLCEQANIKINAMRRDQHGILASIKHISKQRESLEYQDPNSVETNCTLCGQKLDAQSIEESKKQIQVFNSKVKEKAWKLCEEEEQYKAGLKELDLKIQATQNASNAASEIIYQSLDLVENLKNLQSEKKVQEIEIKNYEGKIKQAKQNLETCKVKESPYKTLIIEEETSITSLEEKLIEIKGEIDNLYKQIKPAEFWVNGFSRRGVPSLLLDTITPFLTNRTNEYLDTMTGGFATVTFQTQSEMASGELKDKFQVQVDYKYGGSEYKCVSGGEKRRVDVSILLALGDLAASSSRTPVRLRILDEALESLDADGQLLFIQLLKDKVLPRSETIICITHCSELKEMFENTITVLKESGISRLEEN